MMIKEGEKSLGSLLVKIKLKPVILPLCLVALFG